ncbi:MAG TPA: sigma factor-like helix-turn-helix DNA-binding protein, partial [bacterium]
RQRPPSNVKRKSELEQEVYKKRFMQKITADQIINELCCDGKIKEQEVLLIIENLESELGERARKRPRGSCHNKELFVRLDVDPLDFNHSESQADQLVIDDEQNNLLKNALAQLDINDQLVLQYRYVDGMEISAIARLLKCPRHRINYRIKRGTKKLEKYFKKCGLTIHDFI